VNNPRANKRDVEARRRARAAGKRQRRLDGPAEPEDVVETVPVGDQQRTLDALAEIHRAYDAGTMSLDDLEAAREELTRRLHVD
jgi:hypothetical protein